MSARPPRLPGAGSSGQRLERHLRTRGHRPRPRM